MLVGAGGGGLAETGGGFGVALEGMLNTKLCAANRKPPCYLYPKRGLNLTKLSKAVSESEGA